MRTALEHYKSAAGFLSGVLIGLAVITPVFAAASAAEESSGAFLIVVATVLLALGLMVKATGDETRPVRLSDDASRERD